MEDQRLERARLAADIRLKRAEQAIARRQLALAEAQFDAQKRQAARSGFSAILSPTGVVLAGAALGLIGTAVGKYADYQATKRQQETSVILKASEASPALPPDQQATQRARNLLWFSEAHYIDLPASFIAELRRAANIATGQSVPSPVIQSSSADTGTAIVAKYEGFTAKATTDPSGMSIIGSGHTLTDAEKETGRINVDGKDIAIADGLTTAQAAALLKQDMAPAYAAVDRLVAVKLSPNQRDALASFVRAVGPNQLKRSELLQKLNAGDYAAVPAELMKYSVVGGREYPGLKRRRAEEAELWSKD